MPELVLGLNDISQKVALFELKNRIVRRWAMLLIRGKNCKETL